MSAPLAQTQYEGMKKVLHPPLSRIEPGQFRLQPSVLPLDARANLVQSWEKKNRPIEYLMSQTRRCAWSGAKGDWDFRIFDLVKNPDGTDI